MGAPASPLVIGRYAIYGKIAQGGMASVHFGRLQAAAGFARTVAVKRLHPHLAEEPEFVSTLIDEARMAARIHHPNVVPTLDVVAEGKELLVVMDYVRGEALSRLLKAEAACGRRAPLPVASAVMLGALAGLHAAHEATSERGTPLGIVHRDVSPQNILVGVDGIARIIDFGVAKAAGRIQTTSEGVVKGKLAYMAPEQLAGVAVTRAVDVYAMGVVFWEMLTGKRLFYADSDAALVVQVLGGAKEPPSRHAPNLPAGLDALVMRALARDPAERFATAADMADALARAVPPALPKDVGAWVEQLAREVLAQRAATLAEIESVSGMASVPPAAIAAAAAQPPSAAAPKAPAARAPAANGAAPADGATIVSQPSALSVETPRPSLIPRRRRPLALALSLAAGALGVAVLIAAVSTAVSHSRGAAATSSSSSATPASPPAAVPASVAASQAPPRPPPAIAASAPAAEPSAADLSTKPAPHAPSSSERAAPARARPATAPAQSHPPARPAHPFRFAQPD